MARVTSWGAFASTAASDVGYRGRLRDAVRRSQYGPGRHLHANGWRLPLPVRIVVRAPRPGVRLRGETRLHAETTVVDIRVADAPSFAEGDGFQFDGVSYVVQGEPRRDAERLIWTAELRSA